MTEETQSKPLNELAERQEVHEMIRESEIEQRQTEKKKEQLNMLISALEKGIVSKEQYDVDLQDLKRAFKELEIYVKKAKAQGLATIKEDRVDENEKVAQLFPGLRERGYL